MKSRKDSESSITLTFGAQLGAETHILPHVPPPIRPDDALRPGDTAGAYIIRGAIASGGCGAVYAAEHSVLGRKAAMKVLHASMVDEGRTHERFVQEARAVNLIRHPGIVDIYEFGQLRDGRPYFVMEFLDGVTLETLLRQRHRVTPEDALSILEPIFDALQAAHDAGVIHRDVKASNVMVASDGPPWRTKLLDFGIAKMIHPEPGQAGLTVGGQRIGTPHYMAPEQFRGEPVDPRTDVYALGVLIYRMVTASFPFQSRDLLEIERMHLDAMPSPPSLLAPLWPMMDAVVLRCLEKDPNRRFDSVDTLRRAMRDTITARDDVDGFTVKHALGVHAELRVTDEDHEMMDESLLVDTTQVLDIIEHTLRDAGFQLALQTGSSVLGVHLLPEAIGEQRAAGRRSLGVATKLFAALANRRDADERLHVNVCVHVDDATVKTEPSGLQSVGGRLIQVGRWSPQQHLTSVALTIEAAQLVGLQATTIVERHVLLVR